MAEEKKTPDDGTDPELVELLTAPDPAIAEMLLGILRNHSIPALLEGQNLQDEFAVSQALMGQSGVTIRVPRNRLDEAKKVLDENWGA